MTATLFGDGGSHLAWRTTVFFFPFPFSLSFPRLHDRDGGLEHSSFFFFSLLCFPPAGAERQRRTSFLGEGLGEMTVFPFPSFAMGKVVTVSLFLTPGWKNDEEICCSHA